MTANFVAASLGSSIHAWRTEWISDDEKETPIEDVLPTIAISSEIGLGGDTSMYMALERSILNDGPIPHVIDHVLAKGESSCRSDIEIPGIAFIVKHNGTVKTHRLSERARDGGKEVVLMYPLA